MLLRVITKVSVLKMLNCLSNNEKHKDVDDFGNTKEEKEHDLESDKADGDTTRILSQKLQDFSAEVSVDGVGRVMRKNTPLTIRIFWLLVVLSATGYSLYVIENTVAVFLEYPKKTKIRTIMERRSLFPAVTICSMNVFQRSKVTKDEAEAIRTVYAPFLLPGTSFVNLNDFNHINVTELVIRAAYNYTATKLRGVCAYRGGACNPSFFSLVMTDHGVCSKFDPSVSGGPEAYQQTAGFGVGLYTTPSTNSSEWTMGPFFYNEGFRVEVHEPGTTVRVLADSGIPVSSGIETTIRIERTERKRLPPRHGNCGTASLDYFSKYSQRDCYFECQTKLWVKHCGCRNLHMPGPADVCTMKELRDCIHYFLNAVSVVGAFDASLCHCPADCTSVEFSGTVYTNKYADGYAKVLNDSLNFDLRKSSAGISIYYPRLEYTEEIEEPMYTSDSLLSDLGGAVGLFLGCGLISVLEILYFVGETIWFLLSRWGKRKRTF